MFNNDQNTDSSIQFGNGDFETCAFYLGSMDYLEFITVNATTVDRRIDEFLTLIYDADLNEVVGFKIKGLKHHFNEQLKNILEQEASSDFVLLVLILETVMETIGPDLCDGINKSAYENARKIAEVQQARVETSELDLVAG